MVAQVLVDDAGPDVGHLGPLGELVDDEGVELLVVGYRDVEQEVLVAGDDEHADGVREPDRQLLAADMPAAAQATRVYDDYLRELAKTHPDELAVLAVSLIGPRNQVAKLVRHLELLP